MRTEKASVKWIIRLLVPLPLATIREGEEVAQMENSVLEEETIVDDRQCLPAVRVL
jgi:hypothetical protein